MPVEVYNRMFELWCERQSLDYVTERVDVSRKVVKRYVRGPGDPRRGLEPIEERWRRGMQMAQATEELSLARFRREQMELVEKSIGVLTGELALAQKDVKRRLTDVRDGESPAVRVQLDKLASSIDRMVRLGERLLGGPDRVSEHRGGEFEAWTEEELIEYAETGRVPEHARARLDEGGGE